MKTEMDNNNGNVQGPVGFLLWGMSLYLNALSYIDRSTISFMLGTIVSLLAIAHYIIQIRNNTKKKT